MNNKNTTNIKAISSNYFYCYSPSLYKHLKHTNNIVYITKGTHPSSNRIFWVFEKTDYLKQILDKWTEEKHLKQLQYK